MTAVLAEAVDGGEPIIPAPFSVIKAGTAERPSAQASDAAAALPRILFVHAVDAALRQVHADMRARGYPVAWIGHRDEVAAGAAFCPDVIVAEAGGLDGELAALLAPFSRVAEGAARERACPVILLQAAAGRPVGAPTDSHCGAHPVAGLLDRSFKIGALAALLAPLPVCAQDDVDCDRRMVESLINGSRLLANLQYDFLPKIDLRKGGTAGYEALARLRNLPGVNPEWLFSSVMDADLERDATINAAKAALDLWRALRAENRAAPVAINCSQTILASPAFQAALITEMHQRATPAGALIVEITEDARPVDTAALIRDMNVLRDRGVGFSLDDFGKGATNFDRVFTLPVAELKIDRGFFAHCARHVGEMGILREVIRSCHARGVQTVVEGIETEQHLAIAQDLGARLAQGFYWGRPMPAGAFAHIRGR